MRRIRFFPAMITAIIVNALSGCSNLPSFDGPLEPSVSDKSSQEIQGKIERVPTLSELMTHIQCEIWNLPKPIFRPIRGEDEIVSGSAGKEFSRLWEYQYVVYGILTIDVTDDGALDPALSFVSPTSSSPSRSLGLGLQYGDSAHRQITQSFVLDLDAKGNPSFTPKDESGKIIGLDTFCSNHAGKDGKAILGDLGIQQVIAQGIQFVQPSAYLFPMADSNDNLGQINVGTSSTIPSFGTTLDFTLTYGINGSPTWTLTHFVGPSGASNPFAAYTRTRKDTLVLSFAAANQRAVVSPQPTVGAEVAPARPKVRVSDAADAARNNATLTILQRLLSPSH